MRTSFLCTTYFLRLGRIIFALSLAVTFLIGCEPGQWEVINDIGQAIRDDDDDGWFTNMSNQKVTLTLLSASLPVDTTWWVVVDGIRFPFHESSFLNPNNMIRPVARRAIGTWLLQAEQQRITFNSSIEVHFLGGNVGTGSLPWRNTNEEVTITIPMRQGDVTLNFRSELTKFADPDPNDSNADRDADGILDREEADLAERKVNVGDPGVRDLVIVVGFMHGDWAMTPLTRQLLLARFRQRGINIYIAFTPNDHVVLATPGLMTTDGQALPRDHALSLDDALAMRTRHVFGVASNYVHLLVLAEKLSPEAFGWGQRPGHTLIARSHLPVLGPDHVQYQAKAIMHELGHNLGLCHPTESGPGDQCPTGTIPVAERGPEESVMGAPIENEGDIIGQITNALARPLDYSRTQWTNMNLAAVRP